MSTEPRYRVPAEWETQACVWLAWPHNLDTWPGHFDSIPGFFADWARTIAESTLVRIIAEGKTATSCRALLKGEPNIELVEAPTDDCWIRDYGPTFVVGESDGAVHGVDWKYNAWGGKYPPWEQDDAAAAVICHHAGVPRVAGSLCLEGGALEFDGQGRLLTTPNCLINDSRNPNWPLEAVVQELHRRFGIDEVVWVDGGALAGDDTDGHIDQLARFVDAENVVVAVCEDEGDENAPRLEENFRQLRLWGDTTHPYVQIHRLPIPPARYVSGKRVPESYCNFLRLGTDRLLMPTFGASTDPAAIGLLRELSSADVVAIDCRELAWGLGTLHCASRDQPEAVPDRRQ